MPLRLDPRAPSRFPRHRLEPVHRVLPARPASRLVSRRGAAMAVALALAVGGPAAATVVAAASSDGGSRLAAPKHLSLRAPKHLAPPLATVLRAPKHLTPAG